nr:TonB-dependent receptor [Kofleriaceae bacterium]
MTTRRKQVRRCAAASLTASVLAMATSAMAQGAGSGVVPVENTELTTPPAPPVAAPPCRGTLDGHVIDDVSHEPLVDATVSVGTLAPIATDDKGHFLVTGLCPGAIAIEAGRIDYISQSRTLIIGDGASTSSIELELRVANVETIEVKGHAPPATDMRSTGSLKGAALEQTRGKGLAEALAQVPGVTLLRSGTGMAKPIVRGQFGRRLLLLVDGMRHRAQEWGLDHAPEIDPFIADKIDVVRGAAGVQYGPDAIGGAVLVSPPRLLTAPGYAGEAHLIGYNNGLGGVVAARLRAVPLAMPKLAYLLEGSATRLASASTPDYPINNTGTTAWNLGGTVGYRQAHATYELSYRHYQAKLGICSCLRIDSIEDFYAQLGQRQPSGVELFESDFSVERPYQQVGHDMVLARGHWDSARWGTLTATYGYQHNLRREFEQARQATTDAQFNFRLQTHELNLTLEPNPIHVSDHWHLRSTYGVTGVAQVHGYYGLPLIPDYTAFAGSVFALQRLIGHDIEAEAGVRY